MTASSCWRGDSDPLANDNRGDSRENGNPQRYERVLALGDRIGRDHAGRQGGNGQLRRDGLSIEPWFHGGGKREQRDVTQTHTPGDWRHRPLITQLQIS